MEEVTNKIHDYSLEEIMGERFARYSKYIIQDRAIPDVRDGLKPVQRRILYAMYKDKNTYDKQFKKSAKAVGNVIGNYHPHGDTSVYDAIVRMSQNFKLNHPYIEMDGNNGSIDGDPAAAMRYTEARLSKISGELLRDIDKDTVIFAPNYDDTTEEPTVLPCRFPNLLVNGTTGISAGYATNIPPHNLAEIIDATIKRIDSPNCHLDTILDIVKGPDFPTGGIVEGTSEIRKAYTEGRGRIVVRSRYEIVKTKGMIQIVITEIPYEVNKALMIKKIDEIRIDKKIDGILEVRDESDKHDNLRVVIDLKSGTDANLILNYLLKNTELQVTYNFNMVTIVNRRPKLLGIIPMLDAYIEHQKEVVTKRTNYDLNYAKNEIHITEGLVKAISILDEVIKTIRASKNKADARENLMKKYDFTEAQAEAIVMLHLYRLTNFDVTELEEKLENLRKVIEYLSKILENPEELNNVIKDELRKIKKEYAVLRKTTIKDEITEIKIDMTDMISKENYIVVLTNDGYLKKVSLKSFALTDGATGLKTGDYPINITETSNLNTIMILTNLGNYLYIPVHMIQEGKWKELGKHISNIVTTTPDEKVIASYIITPQNKLEEIILFTKNGQIMKTKLANFEVSRYSKAMTAMKLKNDDELVSSSISKKNVLMLTKNCYYLIFNNEEVPLVNIKSSGVKGINLKEDVVISALTFDETDEYLNVFTNNKTAKRVKLTDLNILSRAKKGSLIIKKTKSVTYTLQKCFISSSRDNFFIKINDDLTDIKNSEIPIMDKESTGSNISKNEFNNVFKEVNIIKLTPPKEEKQEVQEPKMVEMTIDDFLDDFKL